MSAIRPAKGEEGYTLAEAEEQLTYWQGHFGFLNQLWDPELTEKAKKILRERTEASMKHIQQFTQLIIELRKLPKGEQRLWSTGAAINPYLVKV